MENCDCGEKAKFRSHAYGWVACEICVDDKLQEDIEEINEEDGDE